MSVLWMVMLACTSTPSTPNPTPDATPVPVEVPDKAPQGVRDLRIEDPPEHYGKGFVQMHPVVRLPSNASDPQVEVWLHLPEDGEITLGDKGLLSWPPGTIADRVEWRGSGETRHVVDVRGGSIASDGTPQHRLFRPTASGAHDALVGVSWAHQDLEARSAAVERLIEVLLPTELVQGWTDKKRKSWSGALRRKSNCTGCHVVARPMNAVAGEHGLTNRGTDAVGWFTPASMFADTLPIESYGSVDLNTSPWLTVRCGDKPAERVDDHWVCPDKVVPMGTFDLSSAVTEGDVQALAVCRVREMLAARMSADARASVLSALSSCNHQQK